MSLLSPELVRSARKLEQEFQLLNLSARKVSLDEWNVLSQEAISCIPGWLTELLAMHSLVGPLLERPHEYAPYPRYFGFWWPPVYADRITPGDPIASEKNGWWLTEQFINDGFVPLSDESDGDIWLTSISGDASSPVYLYSLAHDEREIASPSLASFLETCRNFQGPNIIPKRHLPA
jgi:hypothetical protein